MLTPEVRNTQKGLSLEHLWYGFGATAAEIPHVLSRFAADITDWQTRYASLACGNLKIEYYRELSRCAPRLARRPMEEATNWSCSPNQEVAKAGECVLFQQSIKAALDGLNRAQRCYPEVVFDENSLIEKAKEAAGRYVERVRSGQTKLSNLRPSVNSATFKFAEADAAIALGVPVTWLRKKLHTQIPVFVKGVALEQGRLPGAEEIANRFGVRKQKPNLRIIDRFLQTKYGVEPPNRYTVRKPSSSPVRLPTSVTVEQVIRALPWLTARQLAVVELRWGLTGPARTLKETAILLGTTLLGTTPQNVLEIQKAAVKRILQHQR